MAAVTCPHCEKRFKPKDEMAGKKVKCPFCKEPVAVPADKEERAKNGKKGKSKVSGKAKEEAIPLVETAPEVIAAPAPPPDSDLDADENPYGVTNQDLRTLCPNCANEMKSANAIICLTCGYNTLTREIGKTEKTIALTFKQRLIYLLPAIAAGVFTLLLIVFQIYYAVVSPLHVSDMKWLAWTDSESIRMWSTVIFLGWIWSAGMFCYSKFIVKPKPNEVKTS